MTAGNDQFRQVLRGYEPSEVDRRIEQLTSSEEAARAQVDALMARVQQLEQSHREAERTAEETGAPAAPSYDELGSRIGQMLSLADEEANELRTAAKGDADAVHHTAHQAAELVKSEADAYAQQCRSEADKSAESMLKQARRQADEMLDGADRDAAARRQEAEAVYETQRAKAAAAAADFEMTLAQRRDNAETEFSQQLGASNEQLAAMEKQIELAKNEAEKLRADAEVQARRMIEDAEQRANETVAQSRAHADRVRSESERELAAATQRRDSINAQLSNVRQMLATLAGAAPSGLLFSVAEEGGDASAVEADTASLDGPDGGPSADGVVDAADVDAETNAESDESDESEDSEEEEIAQA